ncbi:MAG: GAP family protein [Candidatus Nanopelagicales bacterium]
MLAVVGDVLPLAVGVGISPLPILVVVLMLLTPRAKATASAYLVGWVLGLVLVSALAALLARTTGISTGGEEQATIAWGQVVFGLLLLVMGWQQWRTRPAPGEESALPGWLSALDRFTPTKALGVGLLFSAGNPKNLMLTLTAAVTISASGLPTGAQIATMALFILVASAGVLAPMAVFLATGDSAARVLGGWRTWLAVNNATVMSVLLLVLGALFIGQGLGAL